MPSGEILKELSDCGFFSENPFLALYEIIGEDDLKKYKLDKNISDTEMYIDSRSSYADLKINCTFEIIFRLTSPEKYERTKAIIKLASVRPGVNLDYFRSRCWCSSPTTKMGEDN